VTRARAELWRDTASAVLDCPITRQFCKLSIHPRVTANVMTKLLARLGGRPSLLVGIQPIASWTWRSIGFEQVRGLVKELQAVGAQCLLFHRYPDPVADWAKELGVASVLGEKPIALVETVRLCDALITVDSGLFHLGGTLGVPTVGMFAQTDGEATGQEYESCGWITAGTVERTGLTCKIPCYRRKQYGCVPSKCLRGCRALHRISAKAVVDKTIGLAIERKGAHLTPEERADRMFSSQYGS